MAGGDGVRRFPASDQVGEADQPLRDQFAMLDDVTGMRDDAGAQHFVNADQAAGRIEVTEHRRE